MIFLCAITILELLQGNINEGEEITVKGFLIESKEHEFYLSEIPNVPSCCIGKNNQIKVIGEDLKASRKPQEVKGKIKVLNEVITLEIEKGHKEETLSKREK